MLIYADPAFLQTDARFGVGIFIRGQHIWDEDITVNRDVLVHAFQPSVATGGQLAKPTKHGYILYAGDGAFQLFERQRGNTFIFLNFATEYSRKDINVSIALDKISDSVRVRAHFLNALTQHQLTNYDTSAKLADCRKHRSTQSKSM